MQVWEKELLGMYVSSHPLDRYSKVLSTLLPISSLKLEMLGSNVRLGGIISKLKKSMTKSSEQMLFLQLDDRTASIEAIVFPKTLKNMRTFVDVDYIVELSGRLSDRDEDFKLIVEDIKILPEDDAYNSAVSDIESRSSVLIYLPESVGQETLLQIKNALGKYPGSAEVKLVIGEMSAEPKILKTKTTVSFSDDLFDELRNVPGVLRVKVDMGTDTI
jgi:DNA polymerase-3 subunit alpha